MSEEISEEKVVELVSGDVEGFKNFVEERDLSEEQLERLLKDEKKSKNRSTAKKLLKQEKKSLELGKRLENSKDEIDDIKKTLRRIKKDFQLSLDQDSEEEIDQMQVIELIEGDAEEFISFLKKHHLSTEQLENLLESEKRAKNRKTVKNHLRSLKKRKKLVDDIQNALDHLEATGSSIDDIKEDSNFIVPENEENEPLNEETGEKTEEKSEEEETDSSEELPEQPGDSEKDRERSQENIEKQPSRDSRDVEKVEADERQEILDFLAKHGVDISELQNSSLEDLKKLKKEFEDDEQKKSRQEIEEEAEEDLEVITGAVRDKKEDEESGAGQKIEEFKERLHELVETPESLKSSKKFDKQQTLKILENYRSLDNREKAVKTAHLMKGFLEYQFGIQRELTYSELAEEIEGTENEDLKKLESFFQVMSQHQYLENVKVENVDDVIDLSERVVRELG
ncbi:MAG: hypothetical protein ABEJ83_03080 [Candidatus Nanohaloarchaea archaeon]